MINLTRTHRGIPASQRTLSPTPGLVVVCDPPVDSNSLSIGGTMGATYHRVSAARKSGHEVTLLTGPDFPREPRSQWKDLCRRLSALDPDHIHIVTQSILGCLTAQYCINRHIPFSTDYHTLYPEWLRYRNGWPEWLPYSYLRWLFNKSSAVMPPTKSVGQLLIRHGIQPSKVKVVPNGLDHERFRPEGPTSEALAHLPRPLWLYVGQVTVNKRVRDFLKLDLPGSKVVVGEGNLRPELTAHFPDVLFLGPRPQEELPPIYRSANVFVFPSDADSCGMVMLEALGCGLPVAAYPVMGPIDVITDSRAGFLEEDLGRACQNALTRCKREGCRRFALEWPSWDSSTQSWLAQMAPILTQPAPLNAVARFTEAYDPFAYLVATGVRRGEQALFQR